MPRARFLEECSGFLDRLLASMDARIASLEFAPFGVRVNMVAPDAVFSGGSHKSGLWAEVGPGRMKARGLDEKGLEEFYRNRNLLKMKVMRADWKMRR